MPVLTSYDTLAPVVLTISGLDDSGAGQWQALRGADPRVVRHVTMGDSAAPHRNSWVMRLDAAVRESERPVILVVHGLACHAVAWWVALARPHFGSKVTGALLINPPNIDAGISDIRLAGFGPTPKCMMPFSLIVAADRRDAEVDFFHAQMLAKFWGGHCIDSGEAVDMTSNGSSWTFGRQLARQVFDDDHGHRRGVAGSSQWNTSRDESSKLEQAF